MGNAAPNQNICNSPEYIFPMLYSREGPIAEGLLALHLAAICWEPCYVPPQKIALL